MTFKREKVVIKNFDENSMYCPSCLSKLVEDGSFTYEDVCNNGVYSTKWVCSSKGFLNPKTGQFEQCLCHEYETFWNNDGDYFGGKEYKQDKKVKFILGPDTFAAFNSIAKKCETEIYRNGLPKQKYLSPALCLWFLQPVIQYTYQSNYMGDIIRSGRRMEYLKKDRAFGNRYCIVYVSPVRMFKFAFRQFKKNIKEYKATESKFYIRRLFEDFEPVPTHDKRLYRRLIKWYQNIFYFRLKKEIEKKYQNLFVN